MKKRKDIELERILNKMMQESDRLTCGDVIDHDIHLADLKCNIREMHECSLRFRRTFRD